MNEKNKSINYLDNEMNKFIKFFDNERNLTDNISNYKLKVFFFFF